MPHASVKLKPGVDVNETPALNETGISACDLVRFIPDRNGLGLIQKLGGWTKFFPTQFPAKVRALLGWEDTNAQTHLAVGTENFLDSSITHAQLSVITSGQKVEITPTSGFTSAASPRVGVSTTGLSSNLFLMTDSVSTGITPYDSVYIQTHISIGGVILFGLYPIINPGPSTYEIQAVDLFGNPIYPTVGTSSFDIASFQTMVGTSTVTVTLPNHGFMAGDTYPCLISTSVGGITIYGNYLVQESGLTTNSFTIIAGSQATLNATASINGGNVYYIYSYGVGAPITSTGYGVGGYGVGGYGTGTAIVPGLGTKIQANDWTIDNWGEILVSCPVNGSNFQPIYQWNPLSGSTQASIIVNAPPLSDGMFVAMPQRQIIAWGSTFTGIADPLLIRWCDVNNYDVWTAQVTNQAGSFRIPRGSKVVGCLQGPQQGLVWTDLGLWTMQYIGQPYVYSFNEVGFGCGMIGRKAAATIGDIVYWMGQSQFFTLASNGVKPVPCPVWDVVFQDLDTAHTDKIRTAVNSRFNEITWYYPTKGNGGEITAYVKLNVGLLEWDYGTLARSAWIDQSVLGPPIGADPATNYLYQHETSTDADGQAMVTGFRTGYFAMSEADVKTFVDQVWPDMKWGSYGGAQSATVDISFYVTDYPGQAPRQYGPYPVTQNTQFITPRFRGRLVSIEVGSSDIGSFWRIGNIRYRLQQDGKF